MLKNKMFWLYVSFALIIITACMYDYFKWAPVAHLISWIYPVIFGLVAIFYGIKNMIKNDF